MYQINALNPKEEGHQARKRFGQNFLHDQRVIAKIVRSVNPRAGENIVEIGPGHGAGGGLARNHGRACDGCLLDAAQPAGRRGPLDAFAGRSDE